MFRQIPALSVLNALLRVSNEEYWCCLMGEAEADRCFCSLEKMEMEIEHHSHCLEMRVQTCRDASA